MKARILPPTWACRLCGREKPIAEMVVARIRGDGRFRIRSRCRAICAAAAAGKAAA